MSFRLPICKASKEHCRFQSTPSFRLQQFSRIPWQISPWLTMILHSSLLIFSNETILAEARMLKPAMNKTCVYFLILQHTDSNGTRIILIHQYNHGHHSLPWHVVALLDGVETPNAKLGVALEDHRPTYSTRSRYIQFLGPGVTCSRNRV